MAVDVFITPINSILFISDTDGGETPEITRGTSIWKTSSCVAFATYPEPDGETHLILGAIDEVQPDRAADMDTVIATPNRRLIVETSVQEIVFDIPVPSSRTRIVIWLSHPRWPEEVRIGIG